MARQWEAEATIEADLALKLIQSQFPELNALKIKLLGVGWDNTAYLINDQFVFRFPRRQIAVPLLKTELSLLPKIAGYLPLPIPIPKWAGSAGLGYPWPFSGYTMLLGSTACSVYISDSERMALAKPLAEFLKALHGISKDSLEGCHVPKDLIGKLDVKRLGFEIKKNLEEIALLKLLENQEKFHKILEDSTFLKPAHASVIVHGDFYARHVLVDQKNQLAGVIDWGDIHFGDPGVDLSIAHSFLPAEAHAEFCSVYGEISENSWLLGRLRALFSCTIITLFGHHSGDSAIEKEGLRGLNQIAR
ncbi:MAG TPA: phosphotransferase [Rhabdochlamydiaceae bacterium]|nr:phosphotransferase [Rhabdochlamydiaceae bacterium]